MPHRSALEMSIIRKAPYRSVRICILYFPQGCSLGLNVSVSRRSRDVVSKRLGLVSVSSRSRGNVGRSRSWSRLGLKIKCLGLVSVSYHRVSFTSQYAQLFASLQNCTYIVLNARRLYCLLIHKLMSRLHLCCIHLQLQCSTHYSKSPFPWLC